MPLRLEDIEAIKQLKARYCRALDTQDWELMAQCYSPDTFIDLTRVESLSGFTEPIRGIGPVVQSIRDSLGTGKCVHVTFLPDIEFTGDDTAKGIWGLEYYTWQPPGSKLPILHGFAYSHDDYVRIDGRWLIRSIALDVLWSDPPRYAEAK